MRRLAGCVPRSGRGRPTRYTLPSLLQGHPPSQGSGTLMSLQEGIAVPRSHSCGKPFRTEPAGRRLNLPYRTTTAPGYQSSSPGKLSAVPNPSIPLPASAHTLPKPSARGSFHTVHPHPLLHLPGEGDGISRGEAGMFRRDIRVSDAKRGRVPCRSKEHTASTRST